MNVVDRIRGINRELGVACADLETEDGPLAVCEALEVYEVRFMTPRRAKIAWKQGRCPLCFWMLIRSFGLSKRETRERTLH